MNIDNAIELAKIEAEVDTLLRLSQMGLMDNETTHRRLSNAVIQFSNLYERGGIDSALTYEMAMELSEKIDRVDSEDGYWQGTGYWTLNHEYFMNGDKLTPENVIAEANEKRIKQEIRHAREGSQYRVEVSGSRISPVDDMQPAYGTYSSSVGFEIGRGANSVKEALDLVQKFNEETKENNKELTINDYEKDIGYFTPKNFIIYDAKRKHVLGGVWDNKNDTIHIPHDFHHSDVNEIINKIQALNDEYAENSRADNNYTCRSINDKIEIEKLKLNNISSINVDGSLNRIASAFNYKDVYFVQDDISCNVNEGAIYYTLEGAENGYKESLAFLDSNSSLRDEPRSSLHTSIYKLSNEEGYMGLAVLDEESMKKLILIKSSDPSLADKSNSEIKKPSQLFSGVVDTQEGNVVGTPEPTIQPVTMPVEVESDSVKHDRSMRV